MNVEKSEGTNVPASTDRRGLSQMVFVMIGVGIIVGGLWSLYMGDAPYHPEDQVSQGDLFLAAD